MKGKTPSAVGTGGIMTDESRSELRVRLKELRHAVEIVAIIGAGIWAFYTFIYVERIKPLGQPPILNVAVTTDTSRSSSGYDFATVHVKYANVGAWNMDVVSEAINVFGERVVSGEGNRSTTSGEYLFEPTERLTDAKLIQAWAVRLHGARGGETAPQILLLPGQTYDEERTVIARRRDFPALRVDYDVFFAREPIASSISISVRRSAQGAVTISAHAPNDSGSFIVPLP